MTGGLDTGVVFYTYVSAPQGYSINEGIPVLLGVYICGQGHPDTAHAWGWCTNGEDRPQVGFPHGARSSG